MFDVILAMTKNNGIGFKGKLPWHCKEELAIFKKKTLGKIVIVGFNTALTLPHLKQRTLVVLSKKDSNIVQDQMKIPYDSLFHSLDEALINVYKHNSNNIIVIGGAQIYNHIFKDWKDHINEVHLSIMNDEYKCDTFVNFNPIDWTIKTKEKHDKFTHYVLSSDSSDEKEYLSVLHDVFQNGWLKEGRNGNTKSVFGKTMTFDLTKGFPLLTTKKMFFRGVVEELLFFIRGHTDSQLLEDKKINIWKGNTNRNFLDSIGKNKRRKGIMGPMYGYQWRYYNAPYDEENASPNNSNQGMDQLEHVINQIKNDPHSRRILLTDFNPLQAQDGVLYPCHSIIIQFYVSVGYLDIFCYNRSQDLFLGTPFNIASTALLLTLIANITNLTPRKMTISMGDCHIYEEHFDAVQENLTRIPHEFPELTIIKDLKTLKDIENLKFEDITISNYSYYPSIKAPMIS